MHRRLQKRTRGRGNSGGAKVLIRQIAHADDFIIPGQTRQFMRLNNARQAQRQFAIKRLSARHKDIQPHLRQRDIHRHLAFARSANAREIIHQGVYT